MTGAELIAAAEQAFALAISRGRLDLAEKAAAIAFGLASPVEAEDP